MVKLSIFTVDTVCVCDIYMTGVEIKILKFLRTEVIPLEFSSFQIRDPLLRFKGLWLVPGQNVPPETFLSVEFGLYN